MQTQEDLQKTLLKLNLFEDNEYLQEYCYLIYKNQKTKRKQFKTQKHHFIPVCYYKLKYKIIDREEATNLAEKDINNLCVNLKHIDHALAHLYLFLATKDSQFKYRQGKAIKFILGRASALGEKNLITELKTNYSFYQNYWEEYSRLNSELQKGKKGRPYTEEMKRNFSKKMKGHPVSKKAREKIRLGNLGNKNALGHKLSEEAKNKISSKNKGKHYSIETEFKKGHKTWNTGLKNCFSLEAREKMSKAHKGLHLKTRWRAVLQYDLNNNFVREWACPSDAAKTLNISVSRITNVCNYKTKQAYGYIWRFKEEK